VYKNNHQQPHPIIFDGHTKTTTLRSSIIDQPRPHRDNTIGYYSKRNVPAFHSKAMLLPPTKTNQWHIASL
jgi:hypothetical protein